MTEKELKALSKKYSKKQLFESLEILSAAFLVSLRIVDGCSKHPSYKAKRPPKVDCEECRALYFDRQFLNEIKEEFFVEKINQD